MTLTQALTFVKKHGIVLESGRGPVVTFVDKVAGETVRGSWWGHPKGREIFTLTRALRESNDICVCRVVGGKITYVHRRLWPALVRIAPKVPRRQLAMIHEVHTAKGRHEVRESPFPRWVPAAARRAALKLTDAQAVAALGEWSAAFITTTA